MANAYTNTNTNMTTSTGLTPGMQTYYNRELLRTFEPNLVHLQFGENYRMPMNSGITMNMRKMIPVAAKTTALEEGNPGDGKMLAEVAVTTTIQQFGDYARCSDWLDMVHLDENITRRVQRFGDAGARSVDALVRDELATCTNVIYAGGKTARAQLTAADKLTSRELRKAVRTLKKNLAEKFNGYYVAIVGPDTVYDLQEDDAWVKVSEYQDKENIYTGEVGRLFGIRFVESTEAKIFEGAGASSADVASRMPPTCISARSSAATRTAAMASRRRRAVAASSEPSATQLSITSVITASSPKMPPFSAASAISGTAIRARVGWPPRFVHCQEGHPRRGARGPDSTRRPRRPARRLSP